MSGEFRGKRLFAGRLFAGRLFGPVASVVPAPPNPTLSYPGYDTVGPKFPKPRRDRDDDVLLFLLR